MNFFLNNLGRGFLYTFGKFLAIGAILILLALAFSRFPKDSDYNSYNYFGGWFNEK